MVRCVILGGGGHAGVVVDALVLSQLAEPYAVLDANPAHWGRDLLGVPIRGGDEKLAELIGEGVTCFLVGMGGTGDNRPRARLFEIGCSAGLRPLVLCHPSSVCAASTELAEGTVVLAGAIVNAGVRVGRNVIINTGAIIEHHCVIEDHVHIATGARIAGTVHIKSGGHIGIGATVREGLTVGERAIVGAGAVVVKDVDPWTVVVGVPARPLEARINL